MSNRNSFISRSMDSRPTEDSSFRVSIRGPDSPKALEIKSQTQSHRCKRVSLVPSRRQVGSGEIPSIILRNEVEIARRPSLSRGSIIEQSPLSRRGISPTEASEVFRRTALDMSPQPRAIGEFNSNRINEAELSRMSGYGAGRSSVNYLPSRPVSRSEVGGGLFNFSSGGSNELPTLSPKISQKISLVDTRTNFLQQPIEISVKIEKDNPLRRLLKDSNDSDSKDSGGKKERPATSGDSSLDSSDGFRLNPTSEYVGTGSVHLSGRMVSTDTGTTLATRQSTDASGHKACARLMANLVSEADAATYFLSRQSHKQPVKFLHLLPIEPGYSGFSPYEMEVVSESTAEAAPLHYVMSETACTAITKVADPETGIVVRELDALSLAAWLHDRNIFNMLRKRYKFYGKFLELRTIHHWLRWMRRHQFARRRKKMAEALSWNNQHLSLPLIMVRKHAHEITQLSPLDLTLPSSLNHHGPKTKPFSLEQFRQQQSMQLDELFSTINSLLHISDTALKTSLAGFQLKPQSTKALTIAGLRQESEDLAQRTKLKAVLEGSLPVVTKLGELIIAEALVKCARKALRDLLQQLSEPRLHCGLFEVSISFRNQDFEFDPPRQALVQTVMGAVWRAIGVLKRFTHADVHFENKVKLDHEIQTLLSAIESQLNAAYKQALQTITISHAAALSAWLEVSSWEPSSLEITLKTLERSADHWSHLLVHTENLRVIEIVSCLQLNGAALKDQLQSTLKKALNLVKTLTIETARGRATKQLSRYRSRSARLALRPTELEAFTSQLECLKTIQDGMPRLRDHRREVEALYRAFQKETALSHADTARLGELQQHDLDFRDRLQACLEYCQLQGIAMKELIALEYSALLDDIARIVVKLKEPGAFDDVHKYSHAKTVLVKLQKLQLLLNGVGRRMLKCRKQASILGAPPVDLCQLNECQELFDNVSGLWSMIDEFESSRQVWLTRQLHLLDPSEISRAVHVFSGEASVLHRSFGHSLSSRFLEATTQFKLLLPAIFEVCNPALTTHHVEALQIELAQLKQASMSGAPRKLRTGQVTLSALFNLELSANLGTVHTLVTEASEGGLLEAITAAVREIWTGNHALPFIFYSEGSRVVISNLSSLWHSCDDHLRSFTATKQKDGEWVQRLKMLRQTLSALIHVQRILSQEDLPAWNKIRGNLPVAAMNTVVHQSPKLARELSRQRQSNSDPSSVDHAHGHEVLSSDVLNQCNDLILHIEQRAKDQRESISSLLTHCPRLGLLPKNQLTELFNPALFVRLAPLLFPGISKLVELSGNVVQAKGLVGELVELGSESVALRRDSGEPLSVAELTNELELSLARMLRLQTRKALKFRSHVVFSRTVGEEMKSEALIYLSSFPTPCLLLVEDIRWSSQVDSALHRKSGPEEAAVAIDELAETGNEYLDFLSQQLTFGSKKRKSERVLLGALMITQLGRSDVLKRLGDALLTGPGIFEWQSVLRFKWDKDHDMARYVCGGCGGVLGGEYHGQGERLVITPLTDRALLALQFALRTGRGVEMVGVGRRDAVANLAASLRLLVIDVVLTASSDFNWLRTIVSVGGWAMVRGDVHVLTANLLEPLQQAVKLRSSHLEIENRKITMKVGSDGVPLFGIFMFPGPTQTIPLCLTSFFRPLAVVQPDNRTVCCILLAVHGLPPDLGPKLTQLLTHSFGLPSDQTFSLQHRLNSLRTMKHIIESTADESARSHRPPAALLAEAIHAEVRTVLSEDTMEEWGRVVTAVMGTAEIGLKSPRRYSLQRTSPINRPSGNKIGRSQLSAAAKALGLCAHSWFVSKVAELQTTLQVRSACLILGSVGGGKSSVMQCLGCAMSVVRYPPIYLTGHRTHQLEAYISDTRHPSSLTSQNWVTIDGGEGRETPAILALLNGSSSSSLRLLMEDTHIAAASPSMLASCGVVVVDPCASSLGELIASTKFAGKLGDLVKVYLLSIVQFSAEFNSWAGPPMVLLNRTLQMLNSDVVMSINVTTALCGFIFSCAWGCGGSCGVEDRTKFSDYLRDILVSAYSKLNWDAQRVVRTLLEDPFSCILEDGLPRKWTLSSVPQALAPTERFVNLCGIHNYLAEAGLSTCVVGASDIGKTVMVREAIQSLELSGGWSSLVSSLGIRSKSTELWTQLTSSLVPSRPHHSTPSDHSRLSWLVDDFHLPEDGSDAVELILDAGGCHTSEGVWVKVSEVAVTGTSHRHRAPPSARFLRHFMVISLEEPSAFELCLIFRSHSRDHLFTHCSVDLFLSLRQRIKASPSSPYYSLNCSTLENLARRIVGVNDSSLFAYECCRVFRDRLRVQDTPTFDTALMEQLKSHFEGEPDFVPHTLVFMRDGPEFKFIVSPIDALREALTVSMPKVKLFNKVVVDVLRLTRALEIGHCVIIAPPHSDQRLLASLSSRLLGLKFEVIRPFQATLIADGSHLLMRTMEAGKDVANDEMDSIQSLFGKSEPRVLLCLPNDGAVIRRVHRQCPRVARATVMTLSLLEDKEVESMLQWEFPALENFTGTLMKLFQSAQMECQEVLVLHRDLFQAAVTCRGLMTDVNSHRRHVYSEAARLVRQLPDIARELQTRYDSTTSRGEETKAAFTMLTENEDFLDVDVEDAIEAVQEDDLLASELRLKLTRVRQLVDLISHPLKVGLAEKLREFETRNGDALVVSAILCFLGPIEAAGRRRVMAKWRNILSEVSVSVHPQIWTNLGLYGFSDYEVPVSMIHADGDAEMSIHITMNLFKARRLPLLLDPDYIARDWLKEATLDRRGDPSVFVHAYHDDLESIVHEAMVFGRSLVIHDLADHLPATVLSLLEHFEASEHSSAVTLPTQGEVCPHVAFQSLLVTSLSKSACLSHPLVTAVVQFRASTHSARDVLLTTLLAAQNSSFLHRAEQTNLEKREWDARQEEVAVLLSESGMGSFEEENHVLLSKLKELDILKTRLCEGQEDETNAEYELAVQLSGRAAVFFTAWAHALPLLSPLYFLPLDMFAQRMFLPMVVQEGVDNVLDLSRGLIQSVSHWVSVADLSMAALVVAAAVLDETDELPCDEWLVLVKGPSAYTPPVKRQSVCANLSTPSWMLASAVPRLDQNIKMLSGLYCFRDLWDSMCHDEWTEWACSDQPEDVVLIPRLLPRRWRVLSPLQRLLLVRVCRPERFHVAAEMFCESILYGEHTRTESGLVENASVSEVLSRVIQTCDFQHPCLIIRPDDSGQAEVTFLLQKLCTESLIVPCGTLDCMQKLISAKQEGGVVLAQASDIDPLRFSQLDPDTHQDFKLVVCATQSWATCVPLPVWHGARVLIDHLDDILSPRYIVDGSSSPLIGQAIQLYRQGVISFEHLRHVLEVMEGKEAKAHGDCVEAAALEVLLGHCTDGFKRRGLEEIALKGDVAEADFKMDMVQRSTHFLKSLQEKPRVVRDYWAENQELVHGLLERICPFEFPPLNTEMVDEYDALLYKFREKESLKLKELVHRVRRSLSRLETLGKVIGDNEDEDIMRSLGENRVPESWCVTDQFCLPEWLTFHERRLQQAKAWSLPPPFPAYWLPGLFNHQMFFALLQRCADYDGHLELMRVTDAPDERGVVVDGLEVVNGRLVQGCVEFCEGGAFSLCSSVLIPKGASAGSLVPIYIGDKKVAEVLPRGRLALRTKANIYFRIQLVS